MELLDVMVVRDGADDTEDASAVVKADCERMTRCGLDSRYLAATMGALGLLLASLLFCMGFVFE